MSRLELKTNSEEVTGISTSHSRNGSKYSMTLRSRCQDDCCAGPGMEFGRLTPTRRLVHRHSSSRSPSISRRHRQHHTHHQAAPTIVGARGADASQTHSHSIRELRTQKQVAEQVQKVVEEKTTKSEDQVLISKSTSSSAVNNKSIQTSGSKLKTSGFGHHSYSDYSSGFSDGDVEDDIKTDYTYATSASYCTSVTAENYENPNMSRCRLHFTRSSSSLSPTELDESGHNRAVRGVRSKIESFQNTNEIHNSNKLGTFSTYDSDNRKQKYNPSHRHRNKENTKIFKKLEYIYGIGEEQDSKVYVSHEHKGRMSNSMKPVSRYTLREWLAEKASWLWHYLWIHLYKLVSHVLLLDTWFLSRFSRINRKLLLLVLLPLLLFLLLYLCGSKQGEEVHMISGPLGILSSLSSSMSFMWPKRELKTSDQQITTEAIPSLVSKVLREEVAHWTKQMVTEQETYRHKQAEDLSTHTTQLSQLYTQVEAILLQFKHVNEEIRLLRTKVETDDTSKMGTTENQSLPYVTISQLDNKFDILEQQIKGLQDVMTGMKNCCRNQSEYLVAADNHLAFLLTQVMNGNEDVSSVFTTFGQWLKNNFVTRNQFTSQMSSLADRVTSELTTSMKQRIEKIAETAAAAIASSSAKSLREELSKEEATSASAVFSASINGSQKCASEEEVKKVVRDAIYLYDADKTGLVDFALESQGGIIVSTRCSETYQMGVGQYRIFGIPIWHAYNSPRTVIQPNIHPGECWAFKGSFGYLVIKLSAVIKPTAFTIEHIPKSLSPTGNIDSAPKDFTVLGLWEETDLEGKVLGEYTYDQDGEPLQHFIVKEQDPGFFSVVEVRIHSNHGNMDYTCVYRIRVHGVRQ